MKDILGRKDFFDFPELKIKDVPCKIDSGAFMSVIHCTEMEVVDDYLQFKFGKHPNFHFPEKEYRTKKFSVNEITSSNGDTEKRYTVRTPIRILNQEEESEFTLTTREEMESPVLIGRLALENFLIDVTKTNVSFEGKYKFKKK